ncbi:MAG: DUF3859 domain-containing protein [Chthoniobacter sp.]|nr:DUF3859 domain-containing protein [Chthoniobacter sp.]
MLHSLRRLSLTLLLVSSPVLAEKSPQPKGEVLEFGTFELTGPVTTVTNGKTPDGREQNSPGAQFDQHTNKIPARLGIGFGFRFKLTDLPEADSVDLDTIVKHPPFKDQHGIIKREFRLTTTLGVVNHTVSEVSGYGLERPEELVPGQWTMEHWYHGRKLVSQTFQVLPPDPPAPPVKVPDGVLKFTWYRAGKSSGDTVVINGVEFPYREHESIQEMSARLDASGLDFAKPLWVIIPENASPRPPRPISKVSPFPNEHSDELCPAPGPQAAGPMTLFFQKLTAANREVVYVYKGQKVHRYRIICSSKGTIESPDDSNYSLDGELLGPWAKARERFATMKWDYNSIVDIFLDLSNPLTSDGAGLSLHRELQDILHQLWLPTRIDWNYRAANDR